MPSFVTVIYDGKELTAEVLYMAKCNLHDNQIKGATICKISRRFSLAS
jgi:ligand-binding sensor protein